VTRAHGAQVHCLRALQDERERNQTSTDRRKSEFQPTSCGTGVPGEQSNASVPGGLRADARASPLARRPPRVAAMTVSWPSTGSQPQRRPPVPYLLLAEFDLEAGSTVRHQYPEPFTTEER
jgi:hypothetical protein